MGALQSRAKDRQIFDLNAHVNKLSELPNQLEEAQLAVDQMRIEHAETIFNVTSDYLGHLSNDHLNYSDTERISLYLHNGTRFILAGRYSKNAIFTKPNRSAFPDNEGCIGQTWLHGGRLFIELPEDETEYYQYMKIHLSIDKLTAKNLRMKSRAYCALAIEDGYKRVGIIMFESTATKILQQTVIDNLISEHQGYLKEMLRRTRTVNALVAYQNGGK